MPASVVINDILPYTQTVAMGGQTVFSTNWTANYESDVVVYLTPVGDVADDATQLVPYPAGYSVVFIGSQNIVQVTLITPTTLGDIVTITRQTPADRQNLYTNTNFTPSMLNQDFGILTLVDQQAQLVNQKIGPRYNYSAEINVPVDTILPILAANQLWAKNLTNTEIIAINVPESGIGPAGATFITSTNQVSTLPNSSVLQAGNNVSLIYGTNTVTISVTNSTINSGLQNQLAWYAMNGSVISGLPTSADGILATSGAGVPSITNQLPVAVMTNITELGTQTQALNMGGFQINNLATPVNANDAVNKAYADGLFVSGVESLTGTLNQISFSSPTGNVTASLPQDIAPSSTPTFGGMTLTGNLNMSGFVAFNAANPTNPQDYATKFYVDQSALISTSVYAASTGSLGTVVQSGAGVGATLTNAGTQAVFAVDGINVPTGAKVLIKNTAVGMTAANEGIYIVVNPGSVSTNWVITRSTTYDTPNEINDTGLIVVQNGTTLPGTVWYNTSNIITVDVTSFSYSQFAGGVASITGTANQVIASAPTGAVTLSLPQSIAITSGVQFASVRLSNLGILDANGATIFGLAPTVSAVDYITLVNQITGQAPGFVATGASTDINFGIQTKGLGTINLKSGALTNPLNIFSGTSSQHVTNFIFANTAVTRGVTFPDATGTLLMTGVAINSVPSITFSSTSEIIGTTTNNNAAAGSTGEFLSSVIVASGTSLTSNTPTNLTSLSLTAGDWDVWGNVFFTSTSTANALQQGWISSTSATTPDASLISQISHNVSVFSGGFSVPSRRFSLAGTTTVYISVNVTFTGGTILVCGGIYARRRR